MKLLKWAGIALIIFGMGGIGVVLGFHRVEVARADAEWAAHRPGPIGDIGVTRRLRILPLYDFHAADDRHATGVGVSYLIQTDGANILFDLGNDPNEEDPAPLERNMRALGVGLDDFDVVFVSHAHFDHVGGRRWTGGAVSGTTFGTGGKQPDLSGKRIFAPIPMTYPGSEPISARDPVRIAPGVASTGSIPRKLFVGWIDEQSLVVNLAGRGLVLIVGCGHNTVPRLIERTEAVFDVPIYGIVGGLHYPVPEGRMTMAGINLMRLMGTGKGPLAPITLADIHAEMDLLAERKPGLVALSGHDSSDQIIEEFRRRFGDAHRYVRVGEPIEL